MKRETVPYLKDSDDCPEQTVEVLTTTRLGTNQRRITELTSEQMHSENATQHNNKQISK